MEKLPLVSVCMITYAHEKFIEQAINGVLMQESDFDIELVLANDCSPDKTNDVIQRIKDNHPRASVIKYIKHDKNIGMNANFIDALKQCRGKYVALCDGDDYWTDSKKLQMQIDFLENNNDYVLCFHQVAILKPNGEIVEDTITKVPENHETIESFAQFGNYMHTPSVVYRNVIKEFPPEFSKTPIPDFFLYMLLGQYGKFKYLKDKMSVYRHGVGIFTSQTDFRVNLNIIELFSCILSSLKDEKIKAIILERQFQILDRFGKNYILVSKNSKSNIIKKAIKKLLAFKRNH